MEQAAATLKLAVAADNAGQYTQAMGLYLAGIDALLPVVRAEQDTTRKAGMSARLQAYVSRAEEIKQLAIPMPLPEPIQCSARTVLTSVFLLHLGDLSRWW